jgi:CubicO group peptidase (beta-lactamase class C family)
MLLEQARAETAFSGAAWAVGTSAGVGRSGYVGTLRWDSADPVGPDSLWDLASVTKPIVGLAVMSLVEQGALALDDPVAAHLPDYADTDKAALTVEQLLTHTSGIPGQQPLYRDHPTRESLLAAVAALPLRFPPGENVEYSSQAFMVLGLIAERAAGRPLDELVAQRVTGPAGMRETRYRPPDHARAAATEDCPWRGRIVQGTVHDENAEVLGGVAPHAGLFSTLPDMARLGVALCRGGAGILAESTLTEMTRPRTDHLRLRRSLAWQGRESRGSSAGDRLGANAFGHTGFTGTSLWVDRDLEVFAVLLTNRVHPSRHSTAIARIRPLFHDAAFGRP